VVISGDIPVKKGSIYRWGLAGRMFNVASYHAGISPYWVSARGTEVQHMGRGLRRTDSRGLIAEACDG
jgi:hypothetical protein